MPTVSVAIATYNYGRYLGESLDSVLTQTWMDLEVIVVDDGSSDNTADVVGARKDPRVRYIRQERRGPAAAFNRGLRAATGQFLSVQGADDAWLPSKIARQMEVFESSPRVGLVYTNVLVVDAGGQPKHLHFDDGRWTPSAGWVLPQLLAANFIPASSVLIRREVLDQVGLHDETLRVCEDWDLWLRIAARYSVAYVDEVLVRYRTHDRNAHQGPSASGDSFRVLDNFPRSVMPWEQLAPGTRANAYACAHSRAAVAAWRRGEYWLALRHLGSALLLDRRTLGNNELRLAAKSLLGLAGVRRSPVGGSEVARA